MAFSGDTKHLVTLGAEEVQVSVTACFERTDLTKHFFKIQTINSVVLSRLQNAQSGEKIQTNL